MWGRLVKFTKFWLKFYSNKATQVPTLLKITKSNLYKLQQKYKANTMILILILVYIHMNLYKLLYLAKSNRSIDQLCRPREYILTTIF